MTDQQPTPRGSMAGMNREPADCYTFRRSGGGLFRVEDYGPGRVWVQDLMSATGHGWWADRAEIEGVVRHD